jgi:hypothetical protein
MQDKFIEVCVYLRLQTLQAVASIGVWGMSLVAVA